MSCKVRALLFLGLCLPLLLSGCRGSLKLAPSDAETVLSQQLLEAPGPASAGAHSVRTLYYGSGTDRRRPEYRDSVAFTTETVDASKLVNLGPQAGSRNRYWGFTPEEFPLNARVWYPEGEGPFPLVLIVHGNHDMKDFSDPGYAYLGELLASRGYIMASIDMNFVNGSIRQENDARGWLLLKHLEVWREVNGARELAGSELEDGPNPLFGKVDMERIALIGHSRGGEAVGHAAAFNRLRHYPDDASVTFDFGFDIRSIIAIAPVDGQYMPADQMVPVENVNYMVFHGSHDGDVTSFHGLRLYNRVRFTDDTPRLKTAIYVYRANHGQWNTGWGPLDNGPRSARILDLRALLEPEEQQEFGKLYISAFLDATLKDRKEYLPLFRDHRVAGDWLPKTMYITRFQTSDFRPLVTYEEDIDVRSGTAPGVTLDGDSLAVWREGALQLRSRNRPETPISQDNQALWLGWNNRLAGEGTDSLGQPASYTMTLSDSLATELRLDRNGSLDFLLSPTDDTPRPRSVEAEGENAERDTAEADRGAAEAREVEAAEAREEDREREAREREDEEGAERGDADDEDDEDDEEGPIDLTVEVVDASGVSAGVPLSRYGAIRRPLETRILRRADIERQRFDEFWELVLQSYSIPLSDFAEANPDLDVTRIRAVRFLFDRAPAGTVVVDDIGFSAMDPAYTSAVVR